MSSVKLTLKATLLGVVGIVSTAVITKAVEDYFQWSLFSPIISWVWSGVTQLFTLIASNIPIPLWLLILLFISLPSTIVMLLQSINSLSKKLEIAEAKIYDLANPKMPRLNKDQLRVLSAIASFIEQQRFANLRELSESVDLSHVATEGATDVLLDKGLIRWLRNPHGVYVATLTPEGRACVLHPNFIAEPIDNPAT